MGCHYRRAEHGAQTSRWLFAQRLEQAQRQSEAAALIQTTRRRRAAELVVAAEAEAEAQAIAQEQAAMNIQERRSFLIA